MSAGERVPFLSGLLVEGLRQAAKDDGVNTVEYAGTRPGGRTTPTHISDPALQLRGAIRALAHTLATSTERMVDDVIREARAAETGFRGVDEDFDAIHYALHHDGVLPPGAELRHPALHRVRQVIEHKAAMGKDMARTAEILLGAMGNPSMDMNLPAIAGRFVAEVGRAEPGTVKRIPLPDVTVDTIARVAHEANRGYCVALGDYSQLPWEEAPLWQRESCMAGVQAILNGEVTRPEHSHEGWLAHKKAEGWTYGEVKDPEAKTHPCFRPYAELPPEQRRKDSIFLNVVMALTQLAT